MRQLEPEVLAHSVRGRNLEGATLEEALGAERRLLVFLRHFG